VEARFAGQQEENVRMKALEQTEGKGFCPSSILFFSFSAWAYIFFFYASFYLYTTKEDKEHVSFVAMDIAIPLPSPGRR